MASYTSADLANITAAIAGGVQQAMISGEMVQYRSLSDMMKIKRMIEEDLAAGSAVAFQVRQPSTDRGI